MPFSIGMLLLICSASVRNAKKKRRFLFFAFLWFMLISNEYIVSKTFSWWEPRPVTLSEIDKNYDVGVVLSGGLISLAAPDTNHVELGSHANRFYAAFRLYKAGKIRKVLITGASSLSHIKAGIDETGQAALILTSWGVPAEDILLEQKAKNTRENAVFSALILKKAFVNPSVLLITSGYHVPRSLRCFEKAGVKVTAFPCDFYGQRRSFSFDELIIPNADYVGNLNMLWHEWVGFVVYRIAGYI